MSIRPVCDNDFEEISRLWAKGADRPRRGQMQFPMSPLAFKYLSKRDDRVCSFVQIDVQTGNVVGYISAVKLSDEMVLVGDAIATGKSSNLVWLLTYAYKFIQKSGYKYVLNAVENSTVKKLCLRLNFIHVPKGVTDSLGFSQSCSWFIDPIIEICNQLNIEVNHKHILGSKKNGEWPHYSIKADNTMVHMDLGDILNTLDHPTQPNFQLFIEHSNCAVGEILGENVYLRYGERVYIKSPSVKLLNLYAILSWDDGSAKLQFFDDFIYDDVESHSCGLNIICSYGIIRLSSASGVLSIKGNTIFCEDNQSEIMAEYSKPSISLNLITEILPKAKCINHNQILISGSEKCWIMHAYHTQFHQVMRSFHCGEWRSLCAVVIQVDAEKYQLVYSKIGGITLISFGAQGFELELSDNDVEFLDIPLVAMPLAQQRSKCW